MTQDAANNGVKNALNSKGQGMVEYIIVIGLIALAVIASLSPISNALTEKFMDFAAAILNS